MFFISKIIQPCRKCVELRHVVRCGWWTTYFVRAPETGRRVDYKVVSTSRQPQSLLHSVSERAEVPTLSLPSPLLYAALPCFFF
jgi:hypothetical protein